jgi:hypothetical protein
MEQAIKKDNRKYYTKQFDLLIDTELKTYSRTYQLDKSVVAITAITIVSNREDLLYYRGSIHLEINKEEIFSEGYSVKRIVCLPTVDPNFRALKIGEIQAGNGQIKFEYTDSDDMRGFGFNPYTISLCVDGLSQG